VSEGARRGGGGGEKAPAEITPLIGRDSTFCEC